MVYSLLDIMVFGRIAGANAAEYVGKVGLQSASTGMGVIYRRWRLLPPIFFEPGTLVGLRVGFHPLLDSVTDRC